MFFLSLFLILVVGGVLGYLSNKIKLPSLIIYLILGMVLSYLNLIDESITNISSEIRKIALIIILIKEGLSLDLNKLKKAGRPAFLLSFLPAIIEMLAIGIIGHYILELSFLESFILGSVIGAVSPAVVVPRMIDMIEKNKGCKKGIPQMIIAGSSLDDIIMILCFTSFLTIEGGNNLNIMTFINVPLSIILGVFVGIAFGLILAFIFKSIKIRDTLKLIIILGISFGFVSLENFISSYISFSSLLAILIMGITLHSKAETLANKLALKNDKIWVVAEIFLFTLLGALINIEAVLPIIGSAILLILIGQIFRFCGSFCSTIKTNLTLKERFFVSLSYIPKATVQATIGGSLLDLGLKLNDDNIINAGNIVLGVSIAAILISAPLGALAIDLSVDKLIEREDFLSNNKNESTI